MRIPFGTSLLLLTGLAGSLPAQEVGQFGRLEPGQRVRIKTVGGSRFSTRLGGGTTDSLRFAHATIPFAARGVDSLWIRGHAAVTGMIVGAAVAAPITFGLFAAACEALSEGSGCDAYGTITLLGLAGGAAGALVGAGIGYVVPKWRLRYARGPDVVVRPVVGSRRIGLALAF